jgi:hypothetical protein
MRDECFTNTGKQVEEYSEAGMPVFYKNPHYAHEDKWEIGRPDEVVDR